MEQEKIFEDEFFDLTNLKKKKKKKKTFDLDAVLGFEDGTKPKDSLGEIAELAEKPLIAEDNELDLENFGKKKKKKKSKVIEAIKQSTRTTAADSDEAEELSTETTIDLDVDFTKAKKKKKTKKKSLAELCIGEIDNADEMENFDSEDEEQADGAAKGWTGSDRDYTYDELLRRVYGIIEEKNPEMAIGRKPKFVMRPPQVLRIGTKKTSFANFIDIAKTLHRKPKHLLDFLMAELGTSGSMDGNQQLIIKGRFQAKQIENVLRRYIKEYVTCHTCRSPDTILQKDTRLFFLQCESCGSRCSVASIKSGFQAVTSKRAAIRAKTV